MSAGDRKRHEYRLRLEAEAAAVDEDDQDEAEAREKRLANQSQWVELQVQHAARHCFGAAPEAIACAGGLVGCAALLRRHGLASRKRQGGRRVRRETVRLTRHA